MYKHNLSMKNTFNTILVGLIFLQLLSISCKEHQYKSSKMDNTNHKKLAGILFGIEYSIKVPSEIRVNDLIIRKNDLGGIVGPEIINQYLIKSGIQRVKIKVYHPDWKEGGVFTPEELQSILNNTSVQTIEPENNYRVTMLKELKFPTINKDVSFFEYEWDFLANTPYQINSWDDAEDLLKIDKALLKKEAFEKYRELWDLLQTGSVNKFMEEIKNSNDDLFLTNYFDDNKMEEYKSNLNTFYAKQKDGLLAIDNYELVLLANGKALALEQIGGFKGFGLLLAKGEIVNSLYTNYITLIKSKKTKKFKVQLVNSAYIMCD